MLARWPDEAGRAAYFAGYHAAQALIFQIDGRAPKTHSGVQTRFALLVKDDRRIDPELRAFLGRSYNLKTVADYATGPSATVTQAQAAEALDAARQFVSTVVGFLDDSQSENTP